MLPYKRKVGQLMGQGKIVIIGGGFAGIKAALDLSLGPKYQVTLVASHSNFFIYATLYRVATGGSLDMADIPLSEVFKGKDTQLIVDVAVSLDRASKTITTKNGKVLSYDYLICAPGSQTSYYGIKGLEQYSLGIRTPEQAQQLKLRIQNTISHEDEHYVVVGGGSTGVELAGSLPKFIKQLRIDSGLAEGKINVSLVESSNRILPQMPRDIAFAAKRQLKRQGVKILVGQSVKLQTKHHLSLDKTMIPTKTVVWTGGATVNEFFKNNHFKLTPNGKVKVDRFLQSEPSIFVLGDNADTKYSGMAQTAIADGRFVAKHLSNLANGKKAKPYVAKRPIYVIPAGPHWAAVLWGEVRIYGLIGWWLRRAADFIAYHDYEPWHKAIKRLLSTR